MRTGQRTVSSGGLADASPPGTAAPPPAAVVSMLVQRFGTSP